MIPEKNLIKSFIIINKWRVYILRHEIGRSSEGAARIEVRRPERGARKILGLENAVDAISDAEKPISQRISERAI
jgi:hypothetical protein